MKFFYILANQIVTVLLSSNTVTTLTFNNEIVNCDYGVSKSTLDFKYRRKRTSISLIPKSDGFDTNATCFMKDGKIYLFNLKYSKERFHKHIAVFDAETSKGGAKIYEDSTIRVFDAGKNYFIENKTKTKIKVNESPIDKTGVSSKWNPININGKEVFL